MLQSHSKSILYNFAITLCLLISSSAFAQERFVYFAGSISHKSRAGYGWIQSNGFAQQVVNTSDIYRSYPSHLEVLLSKTKCNYGDPNFRAMSISQGQSFGELHPHDVVNGVSAIGRKIRAKKGIYTLSLAIIDDSHKGLYDCLSFSKKVIVH